MSGFLSKLFGFSDHRDSDSKKILRSKRLKGRSLRMEHLESRELLSVTPADLAAIQDLFPNYEIAGDTNFIEVTSTADSGTGSLRDAIAQAGQTTEDDVIVVRQSVINLADTLQIAINAEQFGSVTIVGITGGAAGLTNLSGNNEFQILRVGPGTELNLGRMNISGGKAAAGQNGGGIAAVDAVLNISDVRFRSNATTGSVYYEYGGAIYQQGGVSTLNDVTFVNNSSVYGSAFAVLGGTTEQTNVSYQNNRGLTTYGECWGGGIYAENANVTLANAAFNFNSAMLGSALMLHSSVTTITNATIAQNIGNQAVFVTKTLHDLPLYESSLDLRNSIVLGNYGSGYFQADVVVNLGTPNFDNNIIGSYYSNYQIDAAANRLGQYSTYDVFGAANLMTVLSDGSPAVNAGENAYVTTLRDVNGNERIQGGTVDLGAFESQYVDPVPELPDLTPFAPDGWESPLIVSVHPGSLQDSGTFELHRDVYVSWALKNVGTLVARNEFKVELLLDGVVVREQVYSPGMPVDYVLWQRGILLSDLAAGEHTLELRLDTLGNVEEADETNNVFTKTFRVDAPRVDLTPFAPQGWTAPIVFTNNPVGVTDAEMIRPYEGFYVSWGMTNLGDLAAPNGFQVSLDIDGQTYWSNYYPAGFPADYFLQHRGIWINGLAAGDHEFELRIDTHNEVDESNESNNVFTRTLTIVEPLADLAVTTPEGWDSPIRIRQDFDGADPDRLMTEHVFFVNVALANRGEVGCSTEVQLLVDGWVVQSFNLGWLEPGETGISADFPITLSPGEHTFELRIDPYDYIEESNEANNVFTKTIFVDKLKPDYVFTPAWGMDAPVQFSQWSPDGDVYENFLVDELVTLNYSVGNIGGEADRAVLVEVYVDGRLYDVRQVSPIWPMSHFSAFVDLAGLTAGEHVIELRIDPNNTLAEENEANNYYRTTINVVAPDLVAADLVFSSTPGATVDDSLFVAGSPIFVHWTVTNEGVGITNREFCAELYLNGILVSNQYVYGDVPAGMELTRIFDNLYYGLPAGEYVFELRIDSQGRLTESDLSNNVLTKTISVVERIPRVDNLNYWFDGDERIVLDWYAPEFDGLRFDVERSVSGGQWGKIGDGVQDGSYWNFSDADLQPGTAYEYRVVAYSSDGQSSVSDIASVTLPLPSISAPDGLSASVRSSSQIDLVWNAVDGATSYRLERAASGSSTWTTVYQGSATGFSNTGLSANTSYVYRVVALDGTTASEASATVSAQTQKSGTAAVPTDLKSTAATKNSISVSWAGNTSNVTEYVVQWSADGVNWSSATVKKNTKSYTITGLASGTEYLVRVAAGSKAGQSNWSDPITAQTAVVPAAPTDLRLVSKTATTATIAWTASTSEVTGYRIEYSFNGNSWSSVTVGTETTITGLKSNKTYTVRIVALNGTVLSEYSSTLKV